MRVPRDNWPEIVATLLLALAALGTAWSSYQAARWNGEQAKASGSVNKTRLQATRAAALANTQTEVDVATFTQWVDAYARRESLLADFYFRRFRKEFKPAVNAWLASRPLRNANAPLTPFAMPQYRLAATAEAEQLDLKANALSARVHEYIQRSTNYVLGVVLFAVTLFFAAMSTKLTTPRLRIGILAVGCLVFLGAVVWIATSPVSVAV
jgi:TRAP-type C4-dicarboxylate transport system permease small subunit